MTQTMTPSDQIVRHVTVNRTRSALEAINATGRRKYFTALVPGVPQGEGDEVDVCFFKIGHNINDFDLDKEYDLRGLKSADLPSLAAVNEADPAFADEHPNATQWEDTDDNLGYAAFSGGIDGERRVLVGCWHRGGWDDRWWFAGVRK